jgi:hypothetical protein
VLSTNDAARLLAAAGPGAHSRTSRDGHTVDAVLAIARTLGFRDAPRLPRATARRIGLAEGCAVRVAEGDGPLRALLVEWRDRAPLRERASSLARMLAQESASLHWLLVARDAERHTVLIAAPATAGRGPTPALVVDTRAVFASDAETLAALAAAQGEHGSLRHLRWSEILGRDGLTRRFYQDLERCVDGLATTATGRAEPADRRTIAVLHASRLLFLSFLEAKGLLDRDRAFLRRAFGERCGGRGAQQRFLEPLFFGTLNTPMRRRAPAARAFGAVPFLNGGLFTRTAVESRARALRFTDDALGALVGDLLGRYRLTARESSTEWSEAAVDPEMLGRAFESLMAGGERRAGGVYYTPQALIERLTRHALEAVLPADGADLTALSALRVLDPACGSGAFLVFALEEIATRMRAAGDARHGALVRRDVLARMVFGVDKDPTAVWLCQLRLWLSVVVEDDEADIARFVPLPNLDRNVREGDALKGAGFEDCIGGGEGGLERLRLRYVRASGTRKRSLARVLDREERARAIRAAEARGDRARAERRDLLASVRSRDLFHERRPPEAAMRDRLVALRESARASAREARRLREGGALPFSFGTHFPALAREGGVSLVLGNPPWVRTHRIPMADREAFRACYASFRNAAWRAGAESAAAGRGFASQADLAALFTERAVRLARPGGVLSLLLPAKLWGALAGGGIRALLARDAPPLAIETWESNDAGFDAVVYPSALLARRRESADSRPSCEVAVARLGAGAPLTWTIPRADLPLDLTPGAPWVLLPRAVRRAFDRLTAAGDPLAETRFGRPILGVKTGCNAAFVVTLCHADDGSGLVRVASGGREGLIEANRFRPLLRGEHLRAFGVAEAAAHSGIVWTHVASGEPLAELPPATRRWLLQWRRALERRSDGRGARWWSVFRTESARDDAFRVVWSDIGRAPRAVVLPAGDPAIPLNSCYMVRAPLAADAHAFAALLNSPVSAAWLGALAEPARGGYRRFLGWTCARLPVPRDWARARAALAPIGAAASRGTLPDDDALTAAVCDAFGIRCAEFRPLLEWDQT